MSTTTILVAQGIAAGHPQGPVSARTGPVRLQGRAFADDGGTWNPLGASLFWALWGERHDPDRLDANLAHLAAHGFDFIRILGMVGASSWEDRTIDPKASDYWSIVGQLFDRLKRHGLRAEVTVFADAQVMMPDTGQRRSFARTWGQFVEAHRDLVMFAEVANEHFQNGFSDVKELREIAILIALETSSPVALSSTDGHFEAAYKGSAATLATIHYDRDVSKADGAWRPVRQPWGWPDEYGDGLPRAVVNNEPIGPDSSVAADADPMRIAMAYAATFVAGNGAYVFHCGAGIRGGGAADLAKGRQANLFDYDQAIYAGLSTMRKLLPSGLASWQRHNSQWDSNPIAGFNKGVDDGRLMRFYAATSGPQFVGVVLDIKRPITVTARAAMDFTVHHPLDGSTLHRVSLGSGVPWTCPADVPGLVLIGVHR